MTSKGEQPILGPYMSELRLSLRNNAGAYGYSVMITCCLATLTAGMHSPLVHEIFLFIVGAVVSFGLVEALATRGFRRSLRSDETTQVVALGSALNLSAVALAIGVTFLVGEWVPSPVSWSIGSFGASITYLLTTSVEMTLARKVERARRLQ